MATHNDTKTLLPQKKQHRSYAFIATTLLTVIAIGGAFYSIKAYLQLHQHTLQQTQQLLAQIATLKQQQQDDKTQWDESISVLNKSQDQLQRPLNNVDKHLQSTLQQPQYQTNDWLLLKARYYLELAQMNAEWSDNGETTSALLHHADKLLGTLHDQRLFKTRQIIAKELAELQALPQLDKAGLLSQLDSSLDLVSDLPLKPTMVAINKKATNVSQDVSSAWRQGLNKSLSLLETLVVVRHHDANLLPLASPAYESVLRESIRLYLQEAQWAVLQNNEAVYQFSLTHAIKKINLAFDPAAPKTKSLIEQLQTLQQVHLTQQKPLVDESLPLLNQVIESKNTAGETL